MQKILSEFKDICHSLEKKFLFFFGYFFFPFSFFVFFFSIYFWHILSFAMDRKFSDEQIAENMLFYD